MIFQVWVINQYLVNNYEEKIYNGHQTNMRQMLIRLPSEPNENDLPDESNANVKVNDLPYKKKKTSLM